MKSPMLQDRTPITGAAGAHPVGTGLGAVAGGSIAGAAVGTAAGPVGTALGAALGALAGGLAGKIIAQQIDPSAEDACWRDDGLTDASAAGGSTLEQAAAARNSADASLSRQHRDHGEHGDVGQRSGRGVTEA